MDGEDDTLCVEHTDGVVESDDDKLDVALSDADIDEEWHTDMLGDSVPVRGCDIDLVTKALPENVFETLTEGVDDPELHAVAHADELREAEEDKVMAAESVPERDPEWLADGDLDGETLNDGEPQLEGDALGESVEHEEAELETADEPEMVADTEGETEGVSDGEGVIDDDIEELPEGDVEAVGHAVTLGDTESVEDSLREDDLDAASTSDDGTSDTLAAAVAEREYVPVLLTLREREPDTDVVTERHCVPVAHDVGLAEPQRDDESVGDDEGDLAGERDPDCEPVDVTEEHGDPDSDTVTLEDWLVDRVSDGEALTELLREGDKVDDEDPVDVMDIELNSESVGVTEPDRDREGDDVLLGDKLGERDMLGEMLIVGLRVIDAVTEDDAVVLGDSVPEMLEDADREGSAERDRMVMVGDRLADALRVEDSDGLGLGEGSETDGAADTLPERVPEKELRGERDDLPERDSESEAVTEDEKEMDAVPDLEGFEDLDALADLELERLGNGDIETGEGEPVAESTLKLDDPDELIDPDSEDDAEPERLAYVGVGTVESELDAE